MLSIVMKSENEYGITAASLLKRMDFLSSMEDKTYATEEMDKHSGKITV